MNKYKIWKVNKIRQGKSICIVHFVYKDNCSALLKTLKEAIKRKNKGIINKIQLKKKFNLKVEFKLLSTHKSNAAGNSWVSVFPSLWSSLPCLD